MSRDSWFVCSWRMFMSWFFVFRFFKVGVLELGFGLLVGGRTFFVVLFGSGRFRFLVGFVDV